MPDFRLILEKLYAAGKERNSKQVREHLQQAFAFDDKFASMMNALHTHSDDEDAKFILSHLNVDKDDNDNWIVSVKGEL